MPGSTVWEITKRVDHKAKPDDSGHSTRVSCRCRAAEALYVYALNPRRWSNEPSETHAAALAWLERASLPVTELDTVATVRRVLDGLCTRIDGKPAAASTIRRKRAIFYNAVGYAVELGRLDGLPAAQARLLSQRAAKARR